MLHEDRKVILRNELIWHPDVAEGNWVRVIGAAPQFRLSSSDLIASSSSKLPRASSSITVDGKL